MMCEGEHWSGDKETYWDYSFINGPARWYVHWRLGDQQSPVNIDTRETEFNADLVRKPLKFKSSRIRLQAKNTGLTASFTPAWGSEKFYLTGGPVSGKYRFHEFHFHWGKTDGHGSEHIVNGKSFSAELHLVHWNTEKFSSFEEAKKYRGGLTVVAAFLELSDVGTSAVDKITSCLSNVQYKGESFQMPHLTDSLYLTDLLPVNKHEYWTYYGSLTTPPCYESVDWIIFRNPVPVSRKQLSVFRHLKAVSSEDSNHHDLHDPMDAFPNFEHPSTPYIGNNFRPVMPVGCRIIWASFCDDYC